MNGRTTTVVGGGAIGGTVAAYLVRAGESIEVVDADITHVTKIQEQGLRLRAQDEEFVVTVPAFTPDSYPERPLQSVYLCTKAQHTAAAIQWITKRLAPDGFVLSLQNGLNEVAIAGELGAERTIGAFINFFADLWEPGVVHYGGPGAFVIGELDGQITPRLRVVQQQVAQFIDVTVTSNIYGYLWSKMAYGAILVATATTDATMAECIQSSYRPVFRQVAREVVATANALRIDLEPFDGWDPGALGDEVMAAKMFDHMAVFMSQKQKVRSGVWRDMAVRHRPTEVHAQYDAVLKRGASVGQPMPLLRGLLSTLDALEAGTEKRGWHNLDRLSALSQCVARGDSR